MARKSDSAPVAIRCRCGNRIVLESRWIGKATGCAECDAQFTVLMVEDPRTKRFVPYVQYHATQVPASKTWTNVVCTCGTKIGLQLQFVGKELKCSRCGRPYSVNLKPRIDGPGETAVFEPKKASSKRKTPWTAAKATDLEKAPSKRPPPPDKMHLLCVCGEQLTVPSAFYNKNMYCAACGALMHLRLGFDAKTGRYELQGSMLAGPK